MGDCTSGKTAALGRVVVNFLTLVAFWIVFSQLDFLGLESATKERAADLVATARTPFYGFFDRDNARPQDAIAVVLITDASVRQFERPYPLPFSQHERLLSVIARSDPAAIFVDLRFTYLRGGDKVEQLLAPLQDAPHIPTLFAAGRQGDRFPDDLGLLADHGAIVAWDADEGTYPLTFSGGDRSVAFDLFSRLCLAGAPAYFCPTNRGGLPDYRAPMALQWGMRVARDQDRIWNVDTCPLADGRDGFWARLWQATKRLVPALIPGSGLDWDAGARCFYHLTIPAERLTDPDVAALLKGRVVFYGAMVEGIPDLATVPVLGRVPGVAVHAMAFDNLLADGTSYVEAAPGSGLGRRMLFALEPIAWLGIAAIIAWRRPAGAPPIWQVLLRYPGTWFRQLAAAFRHAGPGRASWPNLDIPFFVLLLIALFVVNELWLRIEVTSWLGLGLLYLFAREAAVHAKSDSSPSP